MSPFRSTLTVLGLAYVGSVMASPQTMNPSQPEDSSYTTQYPHPNTAAYPGVISIPPSNYKTVRIVHASLGAAAVLILFPAGGILIRVLQNRHMVWIHASIQMFGCAVLLAGASCGIWMARQTRVVGHYHPIMGIVLIGMLALQPILELINHHFYHQYPKTIYLAHMHLWLGRILITFGIIQGGLGFAFSDSLPSPKWSQAPRIAYGVLATVIWIAYLAVAVVWQEVKTARKVSSASGVGEDMEGLARERIDDEPGPTDETPEAQRREYRSSAL